jgi:hypothetical protein
MKRTLFNTAYSHFFAHKIIFKVAEKFSLEGECLKDLSEYIRQKEQRIIPTKKETLHYRVREMIHPNTGEVLFRETEILTMREGGWSAIMFLWAAIEDLAIEDCLDNRISPEAGREFLKDLEAIKNNKQRRI